MPVLVDPSPRRRLRRIPQGQKRNRLGCNEAWLGMVLYRNSKGGTVVEEQIKLSSGGGKVNLVVVRT
jgi:hypothetical protein